MLSPLFLWVYLWYRHFILIGLSDLCTSHISWRHNQGQHYIWSSNEHCWEDSQEVHHHLEDRRLDWRTNNSRGIQKTKSWEEGLLFFGSWSSLSIVNFGLPSLISLSSFWVWASDVSIFNLVVQWGKKRLLVASRRFVPHPRVPASLMR